MVGGTVDAVGATVGTGAMGFPLQSHVEVHVGVHLEGAMAMALPLQSHVAVQVGVQAVAVRGVARVLPWQSHVRVQSGEQLAFEGGGMGLPLQSHVDVH